MRAEFDDSLTSGECALSLLPGFDADSQVLRIVLFPKATLTGVVRAKSSGAPVAGASVVVRTRGVSIGGVSILAPGSVSTGTDGIFSVTFDGIPASISIEASHAGWTSERLDVSLPASRGLTLELTLLDLEHEVAGLVRATGECAVDGATVVLARGDDEGPSFSTKSGADGLFSFRVKAAGDYLLAAKSGRCSTPGLVRITVDPSRQERTVLLHLAQAKEISGRIIAPSGAPWIDIPVGGYPSSSQAGDESFLQQSFSSLHPLELTHTDTDGAFRLTGVQDGFLYELVCVPDPSRPHCWVREPGVRPGTTDLVILVDENRVRGGVLTGEARRGTKPVDTLSFTLFERYPGREEWVSREARPVLENGNYRLEGLILGNEYFVRARTTNAAEISVGPWMAGAEPVRRDISFGLAGEVKARVQYEDGSPARDWLVHLLELLEGRDGPRIPMTAQPSGPEGVVRFMPISPGMYRVHAVREGRERGHVDVYVIAERMSEVLIDVGSR